MIYGLHLLLEEELLSGLGGRTGRQLSRSILYEVFVHLRLCQDCGRLTSLSRLSAARLALSVCSFLLFGPEIARWLTLPAAHALILLVSGASLCSALLMLRLMEDLRVWCYVVAEIKLDLLGIATVTGSAARAS